LVFIVWLVALIYFYVKQEVCNIDLIFAGDNLVVLSFVFYFHFELDLKEVALGYFDIKIYDIFDKILTFWY